LTVKEITDRVNDRGHEAKARTVYRDLEALELAGFPLVSSEKNEDSNASRWKLERLTRITERFLLSSRELWALYLARGVLTPLKDTPFYSDLDSIFNKIEQKLGQKKQEYLQSLMTWIGNPVRPGKAGRRELEDAMPP
jgi:predicted DNA-binding transcriptional regulator YafY